MGRPCLVCVGPDTRTAVALARAATGLLRPQAVVVLSCWRPFRASRYGLGAAYEALFATPEELNDELRERAREAVDAAAGELRAHGWDPRTRVERSDLNPWRVVLAVGDEIDAALIVAGLHDRSDFPPGALGHDARGIVHHTARAVLMIPPDTPPPDAADPLVLAVDGSAGAEAALTSLSMLFSPRPVVVLSAWPAPHGAARLAVAGGGQQPVANEPGIAVANDARSLAQAATERLAHGGWHAVARTRAADGSAWPAIVAAADAESAAAIAVGARARPRLPLIGSVAEGVLRHAARPVLLGPVPAHPRRSG